jgi:hypothetical protein
VQYRFYGESGEESFSTLSIECEGTMQRNPQLDYSHVHHVPVVTQEFIDFLSKVLWPHPSSSVARRASSVFINHQSSIVERRASSVFINHQSSIAERRASSSIINHQWPICRAPMVECRAFINHESSIVNR